MWNRVHRHNNNVIVYVLGQPGSGKSYAALKMAYDLDRGKEGTHRFDIDHVAFTAYDFIQKIQNYKKNGSVIIWDEAGVLEGANARKHWSEANQTISSIFQIMRKNNQIIFITLPVLKFLDSQARIVGHAILSMTGHSKDFSKGKFKFMNLYPENDSKNITYVYPRERGGNAIFNEIRFPLPPKELCDAYEEKQTRIKDGWQRQWLKDLSASNKTKPKAVPLNEVLDYLKKNPARFWNEEDCLPDKIMLQTEIIPIMHRILTRNESYTIYNRWKKDIELENGGNS